VDPGQQLLVDERPRETVVCARKGPHPRGGIRSAENDHRAVRHEAAIERVGVSEQQDVRVESPGQLLDPLVGENVEAVVAELALEESPHRGL
jgi:hypothetical protein